MTIISDLPWDLVEDILSRVSITSLGTERSTCKRWNTISKDQNFTKKHCGRVANEEFLVSEFYDYEGISSMSPVRFDLNNIKDLPSSIKVIGTMRNPVNIYEFYQCDGLFLLVTNLGLVLWNPYLAQTRWVELRNNYHSSDWYALGYDNKNNHKILKLFDMNGKLEIYEFKSNSWRFLDITSNCYILSKRGVSLKGNTYFVAYESEEYFVTCFDFTKERFGPRLHMPVEVNIACEKNVLSCVREEQLAVLFLYKYMTCELEIWITTNIDPNAVSWSIFFKVNFEPHADKFVLSKFEVNSLFIEKEKKVAVVSGIYYESNTFDYDATIVVGEDEYYKDTNFGNVFPYVPSLVEIQ